MKNKGLVLHHHMGSLAGHIWGEGGVFRANSKESIAADFVEALKYQGSTSTDSFIKQLSQNDGEKGQGKNRVNAREQNLLITLKPELYFHMKMEDLH